MIDSHTGGEPTRVVIEGGPPLGGGSLSSRRQRFQSNFDRYRSAIVNEPRGHDAIVGALLCPPVDPSCAAGVIFFNNVGYIGMCGHGTIGLAVTLAHLGRLAPGVHRIETPVGTVDVTLHANNEVSVANVPSYRWLDAVSIEVPGFGTVTGEVAWGGNWFFLTDHSPCPLIIENIPWLTSYAEEIKRALKGRGISGETGEIDHIEISAPPANPAAHSRNFVLCPGGSYDRSPCGTGTSAKVACLYAAGKLQEHEVWKQESITGSIFRASVSVHNGAVIPSITGSAYVTAEAVLFVDEDDPLCWGIRTAREAQHTGRG